MKILQLCKKFPFPARDGESIAIQALASGLQELGCEITLLAMNTRRHFVDDAGLTEEGQSYYREILTVEVDNRIRPWPAFLNLFSDRSYHIERFVSEAFRQALISLLQREYFDVIQLETPYLSPYIPDIRAHSDALISLRAHNVEHEIWERITANSRFPLKRWYLAHLTQKLRRFENEQLKLLDLLVAISERDLDSFGQMGYRGKSIVVPIGMDLDRLQPDYSSYSAEPSLGFIGSLDWMPNTEGLDWFLVEVWPGLRQEMPGLQFHIAGRNCPASLQSQPDQGITVHGEVPDAGAFVRQHSIMIVPLLSGGGMRVKILEAMALGRVVVTTSVGVEGIDASDGQELLIADEPGEFRCKIIECINNPEGLEEMGGRARAFIEQHYQSRGIAKNLQEFYLKQLETTSSR